MCTCDGLANGAMGTIVALSGQKGSGLQANSHVLSTSCLMIKGGQADKRYRRPFGYHNKTSYV